eukprot:SAG31_NODE_2773_length_5114_cov_2.465404_3_plen_157_part_00
MRAEAGSSAGGVGDRDCMVVAGACGHELGGLDRGRAAGCGQWAGVRGRDANLPRLCTFGAMGKGPAQPELFCIVEHHDRLGDYGGTVTRRRGEPAVVCLCGGARDGGAVHVCGGLVRDGRAGDAACCAGAQGERTWQLTRFRTTQTEFIISRESMD